MDAPTPTSTPPRGPVVPLALCWLIHGVALAALFGLTRAVYGPDPALSEAWVIPATLTIFLAAGLPSLPLAALAIHRAVRRCAGHTIVAVMLLGWPALVLGAVWLYALAILTANA